MDDLIMQRNLSEYLTIVKTYPQLNDYGTALYMGHVYYPIAELEFSMDEVSFEDFQPIEKTLLKCFDLRISDPELMANLLGLPLTYVQLHVNDLIAKGQIANNQLTKMGKASLANNLLFQSCTDSKQCFHVDAINGILLTKEYLQGASRQCNILESNSKYLHIKASETIDTTHLCNALLGENLINKYRKKVFNTNIASINDIAFNRLMYVPVFMIWYSQFDYPLLFFKTYNHHSDSGSSYFYKPLFISKCYEHLFDDPSIYRIDDLVFDHLKPLWKEHINQLVPIEQQIYGLFLDKPFDVLDIKYINGDNGINSVAVSLQPSKGKLRKEDIELLVAASITQGLPLHYNVPTLLDSGKITSKYSALIPLVNDEAVKQQVRSLYQQCDENIGEMMRRLNRVDNEGDVLEVLTNMEKKENDDE